MKATWDEVMEEAAELDAAEAEAGFVAPSSLRRATAGQLAVMHYEAVRYGRRRSFWGGLILGLILGLLMGLALAAFGAAACGAAMLP